MTVDTASPAPDGGVMTFDEVLAAVARIEAATLERWVERGWVRPRRRGRGYEFSDIDVARVHLVCSLRLDLTIDEDTLPVVLSLLDQLYALRRQTRLLSRAIEAQPAEVRAHIAERVAALAAERRQ